MTDDSPHFAFRSFNHPKRKNETTFSRIILIAFSYLLIADLVIGGGGRIVTFGPFSFRMLLFFCASLVLLIMMVARNDLRLIAVKVVPWTFVIVTFYIGVALANGSIIHNIIMDANFVAVVFYLPIIYYLFVSRRSGIIIFFDYFTFLIAGFAIITIIVVIGYYLGIVDLFALDVFLKEHGYGGNTGVMPGKIVRVYTVSHLFLQFGFSILFARIIFKAATAKHYLYLFAISIALIITFTRGFWLGVLISLIVVAVCAGLKRGIKIILLFVVGMLFILTVVISTGLYSPDTLVDRVLITIESTAGTGDIVRVVQAEYALDQILAHPLFGMGFGAKMSNQYLFIREKISGREKEYTEDLGVSIELTYIDILRKFGIVGFVVFGVFTLFLLKTFQQCFNVFKNMNRELYSVLLGFQGAFIGFLATVATNPYLLNASGAFVYIVLMSAVLALKRVFGTRRVAFCGDHFKGVSP